MCRKILWIILWVPSLLISENYLLNGGQKSLIRYEMTQSVTPSKGMSKLVVSFVKPQSFSSPSYNQEIRQFNLDFSIPPVSQTTETDIRGNEIITATWMHPVSPIQIDIHIDAANFTDLQPIRTSAPFPVSSVPQDVAAYLTATQQQVPCNHPQIVQKAKEITKNAESSFDAVQLILTYIIDGMRYVQRPKQYDALYSLKTGLGNCQNYSHLAATFMRAVGIPVRIVNGVTLEQPYQVRFTNGIMTMRMAQGRHSWIEVWFEDLGWVPFDPQQMQLFVSNRFIRVEIGLDNNEAVNDGAVRWTQMRGTRGAPGFRESIEADFVQDQINLFAEKMNYGPHKMLFTPEVSSEFSEIVFEASEASPAIVPPAELSAMSFNIPDTSGNLDFPMNVNFLETREMGAPSETGEMVLKKNFLVETAEYVTGKGQKYSQTFILDKPIQLSDIGLALHNFGGNGQIWLELYEDNGEGKPGKLKSTSAMRALSTISKKAGYRWEDFHFDSVALSPGRYWMALAYTGSPIVNWFFSYGKSVGPDDGTRYNTMFDETWSHSLAFEFNYRIIGRRSAQ